MPAYVYTSRPNPLIGSIGDAMLRRGDIAAQRATAIADAESRAAIASGQAWGQAAQSFGNIAGGVATALTDPRAQAQRMELQHQKDLQAGQQTLDQALQPVTPNGPQPEGEGPAPAQHPYLDDQGLYDIPKLTQVLAASGKAHLAPELLKGAEAINDSITKHQSAQEQLKIAQQKVADQQTVMYGDMADGIGTMMKAGMPFDQAFDMATAPGLATKRFDPQQVAGLKAKLGTLPPAQQQAVLGNLMDQAAKLGGGKTLGKDAQELDRYGRVIASNASEELEKATFGIPQPDGTVKNVEGTFNKKTGAYAYQGQPVPNAVKDVTPPVPKGKESKSVLLDGKPAEVVFDPATGKFSDASGADVSGRVKPIPPASVQVTAGVTAAMQKMPGWALDASRPAGADGNALDPTLRMTPNGLFQDAQNFIASGQYPPTGRGNDEAAQLKRAAIDSKVGAIAAAAGMDVPTLRAFYRANAKSLQQLQQSSDSAQAFMATADKNSALLEETLKKLPDTGSPFFNRPLRAFAKEVAGDKNMGPFATYLTSVKNEYAKIISNPNLSGQLTDSARHEAEQLVADNATIPQMLGSLQALKNEGTNRIVSLGEQIQRVSTRMNGGGAPSAAASTAPADGTKGNVAGKPAVWHTNGPKGPGWYSN